jgi:hypothetical protein
LEYVPGKQGVHSELPATDTEPREQTVQVREAKEE